MPARDWAASEYSRIYHAVIKDSKLGPVYADDRAWAAYTRLLITADATYPAPAPLPRSLTRYAQTTLVKAGVLILVGADHYTLSGLQAEREARRHETRNGGTVRAGSADRDPNGRFLPSAGPSGGTSAGGQPVTPAHQLRRDETSKDETSTSTPRAGGDDDPYDEAVRWLASRKAWIDSPKIQTALARMVDRKGVDVVIEAMGRIEGAEDAAQFVYGARNALFPLNGSSVQTDTAEDRAERQRSERRRTLGLEPVQ